MPIQQLVSEKLSGHWQVPLHEAPCNKPGYFCFATLCGCIAAGHQRIKILDLIDEEYYCCANTCCCPLPPQDKNCAYVEGCCCEGLAIAANRYLVQTRFDRENTPCDDCILWTTCLASCIVGVAQCVTEVPDGIEGLVDCLVILVSGCMLTQQEIEIDYVKSQGYCKNTGIIGSLPECQQRAMNKSRARAPSQQQMPMGQPVGQRQ